MPLEPRPAEEYINVNTQNSMEAQESDAETTKTLPLEDRNAAALVTVETVETNKQFASDGDTSNKESTENISPVHSTERNEVTPPGPYLDPAFKDSTNTKHPHVPETVDQVAEGEIS